MRFICLNEELKLKSDYFAANSIASTVVLSVSETALWINRELITADIHVNWKTVES